jgi:hypothetical protein
MARKTETVAHLDASIKRWKTRLKRSVTMIEKLEKKRKRLAAKPVLAVGHVAPSGPAPSNPPSGGSSVKPPGDKVVRVMDITPPPAPPRTVTVENLDIPEFLRRGQAAQKAVDAVIAEEIKAKQAETKTKKARGRIASMKAKKSGDTRKMPVSGRAALDLIKNG